MSETLHPHLCVVGAGSAGLTIAAGAAQMGAETVLIERGKMGGDCLNYGCVPSKSLLAAAKAAHAHIGAAAMGVRYPEPAIDFRAVHDHVQEVIAGIAPHDSAERFEGLGVTVIQAEARFTGPEELEAGGRLIRAKRFVIATGSRPLVPPIPGLERVSYLTNETVFDLTERPEHLVVIGGGAIGCELGQAFVRLGSRVTIVEMANLLPRDDPELVALLRARLQDEGIAIREGAKVVAVEPKDEGVAVSIEDPTGKDRVEGSALLLAAGRQPTLDGLGLEAAGIAHDRRGVTVDARLRSSNKRVFAAGDVAGGPQFTHMASYHAGIIIRNLLFRLPAKVDTRALPWVTYTDPELAQVGLTEAEARARHGEVRVLRAPFAENDRARTERTTEGLVKLVATKRGKVLGASILGPHAGELIQPWVLAIARNLKLSAVAQMIAPYPTLGEANKRAAGDFYSETLFGSRTRWLVRQLLRLP